MTVSRTAMQALDLDITRFIAAWNRSPIGGLSAGEPWSLTAKSDLLVRNLLLTLPAGEYSISQEIAVHASAIVEPGAVLKGPLILGPRCFVASGAYLRGGNWVAADCTFGPGAELKSSFIFSGTKLAHFNFVGDSILGEGVNLEAGSIICNYRNERENKEILVRHRGELRGIGASKFGALVGDKCRIGANAVVAPGALLDPGTVVRRTQLVDQERVEERGGG